MLFGKHPILDEIAVISLESVKKSPDSNVRFCLKPDATELFGSIAKEPQDNKSRRISHDPRSPISLCNLEHTLGRPKLYASKLGKITVKTKTYTFVKLKKRTNYGFKNIRQGSFGSFSHEI